MQRWQYLVARRVGEDDPKVQVVNGHELRDWEMGTLHGFLSEVGEDGWELVGTVNRGATPQGLLILKRPEG